MVITDNKIKEFDKYLKENLSYERYAHSLSTAETAEKLCINFGIDPVKGYFTGLVHDIAREYDNDEIINTCVEKGEKVHEWEEREPVLLHGKAGAGILKNDFSVSDEEILDAVRLHTTGAPGMSSLAKILFISDYIEPCRKHITEEYLENLDFSDMNIMLKTVLESIIEYMKSRGGKPSDISIELLKELETCEETVNQI